jgi:hypothetical protein
MISQRHSDHRRPRRIGLKPDEYQRILDLIGREPSFTELGIFSAMWNEHCSYKSSKKWLRTLPTTGPRVIQGPGENAGVVDIGDGDCVVFKMESHNHPSYIEPYQGAATGVGGILRDVFTMGARPVAAMNALRFGEPDHAKTRHLVSRRRRGRGRLRQRLRRADRRRRSQFDPRYNGNSSSTPSQPASPRRTRSSCRKPRASACRSSISAPRRAATVSAARPWRRPNSTTIEEKRPPCRSATPSPKNAFWKPAWS